MTLRVGSLFSGIGGFDLGLERAGMRTAWLCEQDEFCRRVLAKHWPGVPCYPDVRALRGTDLAPVDVLAGGSPCQDVSNVGKRAGIEGEKSGLWFEFSRLVGEIRPRYVILENVAALRARGLDRVLADLAALGYDAEWDCIRASDVGAPHRRDRLWLVAYPQREQLREQPRRISRTGRPGPSLAPVDGEARPLAHAAELAAGDADPAQDAIAEGREARPVLVGGGERDRSLRGSGAWATEPDVGRVAHGVPDRVDRLRALGNALVPQIAEWIGWRIVAHELEGLSDAA